MTDQHHRSTGSSTRPGSLERLETDALIIGAGPVGLFQAFQLGLLDIHAQIVDVLPAVGGQPSQLYPDKPIYDIPAIPVCSGQELVDRLLAQVQPFKPVFHLNQRVNQIDPQTDGRFEVRTSRGTCFLAKTIFIAAGVGAFEPRRLNVPGFDTIAEQHLFYQAPAKHDMANRHVVVIGGDDAALSCAQSLVRSRVERPASVTLIHRRAVFQAPAPLDGDIRNLIEQGALRFVVGQLTGQTSENGTLRSVQVTDSDHQAHHLAADAVVSLQGLSPRLGPIADWGLAMERKQLQVDTEQFATSVKGIFAIGDINTYPGKKKLIVCGFHECTLAAYAAAPIVHPERPVLLQYTTTSTRLHEALGVAHPAKT